MMSKAIHPVALAVLLAISASAIVTAQSPPSSVSSPPAAASTAEHDLLLATHLSHGLQCASCHQENPPTRAAQTSTCLNCHGPYDALAVKTASANPNPHASHLGDLPCEACHHMHQVSVLYCDQCHSFQLTTP